MGEATTTVGAELKSAWLTEIDIRAGVAPPTTTVPRTPEATPTGGLDPGADENGDEAAGGEDTGTVGSAEVAGLDAAGFDAAGFDGGKLNACGLLTPPGIALDEVGGLSAFEWLAVHALASNARSATAATRA